MTPPKATILDRVDYLNLLDGIPLYIALLDRQLRVLQLNQHLETLAGHTSGAARGINGDDILRANFSLNSLPLQGVLEAGESFAIEGNIISRDRKKIPVRLTLSPLTSVTGKITGCVVTLEDISLLQDLDKKAHALSGPGSIIGHSPKMQEITHLIPIIAQTDAAALITGETGTGKDLVAEEIHHASKRAKGPFIKVNCGALPEALLESELFGYTRGAFTGAEKDRPGMFRLANGGTIFLTEIGDLPLQLQVKLLTVLDDQEFYPLGSSKKVRVDVRVIAATHRDLRQYVRQGKFREDLFYRLNVLRLSLPALRERDADIRLLIDAFIESARSGGKKSIKGVDPAALDILLHYSYPGNVRELRNIIEYAATICQGETITTADLPQYLLSPERHEAPADHPPDQHAEAVERTRPAGRQFPGPTEAGTGVVGWDQLEKKMIMDALLQTSGKRTAAAALLGWSRSKLWRKIIHHGLE